MSRASQIRLLSAERGSVQEIAAALSVVPARVRELLSADSRFFGMSHSQRRIARAFKGWSRQVGGRAS